MSDLDDPDDFSWVPENWDVSQYQGANGHWIVALLGPVGAEESEYVVMAEPNMSLAAARREVLEKLQAGKIEMMWEP